jgi:uncharacterized membrane protein
MPSKDPILSKTLIFNLIAFAMALALRYGYGAFEPSPAVEPLAAGLAALIAIVAPLVNVVLRFATNQPVSLSKLFTFKR